MMTAEKIEDWREIVKPFVSRFLYNLNYEGAGQQDKEEFEREFDEILDLARAMLSERKWVPFESRSLTKAEKEDYPYYDTILIGPLPDDGQRILVTIHVKQHEAVQIDEYHDDDGSYLDSGYEIGTEATAWMPLPEPYENDEGNICRIGWKEHSEHEGRETAS